MLKTMFKDLLSNTYTGKIILVVVTRYTSYNCYFLSTAANTKQCPIHNLITIT